MKFFSYARKHPIFFGIIIVLFFFIISYGVKIKSGKAILPFGGVILAVQYCSCSANIAVTTSMGIYSYNPYSTALFPFYQIYRPGAWILGTYVPGAVCLVGVPPACTAGSAPFGTIIMAGTSM